jgi:CHAT domain-containing protein
MNNDFEDPKVLRRYLLGALDDEVEQRRIEERIIADDEMSVHITIAEEELIEEYLDGRLNAADSDRFTKFFLAPAERREHFRLIKDLRAYASKKATAGPQRSRSLSEILHPLTFRWLRFAAVAAVLVIVGLGFWRFAIYKNDTDKGLAQLQNIYRDSRPFESRVTALPSFAPYSETRGAADTPDPVARRKAELYLTNATIESPDARTHQALAMFYLTGRDYDEARIELNLALEAAPDDAKLQSDAGAAFLEMAKDAKSRGEGAKWLRLLDEASQHIDRAITLDPKLLEARFNKALSLEAMPILSEQPKTAWREYLEIDPNSKWADEAKRHLQTLEENTPREVSADELESNFFAAFRAGDEEKAGRLISENRELIREKYLPQRLAMSYVSAPEERRDELLRALEFAGKIEMKQTGDPFANEIARFYLSLPADKLGTVKRAQEKIREGYKHCLDQRYDGGLGDFQEAKALFEKAGDEPETKLAQYFVAYGLINTLRNDDAFRDLNAVASFAKNKGYIWLQATALYWVAGSYVKSKQPAMAEREFKLALSIAESINDSYAKRRNLIELANLHSNCAQYDEALKYTSAVFEESGRIGNSSRQRYRDLFYLFEVVFDAGLFRIGEPIIVESVYLADQLNDEMWKSQSRGFAGIAFARSGDIKSARKMLEESKAKAEAIVDAGTRAKITAFSDLRLGEFERSARNYDAAEKLYAAAAAYLDTAEFPPYREQAHIGLLQTYLALGRSKELEEQIPINIQFTDEYRSRLSDEGERIGFFASRQNIYDIASAFELSRGNAERAYDYAEESSSRSLLDRMQSVADDRASKGNIFPKADPTFFRLREIREQMPASVQIVQYSIFDDKIAIWLVSRDRFTVMLVSVLAKDLETKVTEFVRTVSRPPTDDRAKGERLARELYDLLIRPVRDQINPSIELCLIPSRALFDLPFAALISPEGKPLISDFQILFAPSANVLIKSSETAGKRAAFRESLLAVGNPSFDHEAHEELLSLENAEVEAIDVAKMYPGSKVLLRDEATKSAFLSAVDNASVIHFAGHYVAYPGAPMASYMLFAHSGNTEQDEELTGRDLGDLSFAKTKLMVLAACDTGVESYVNGEGMIGMSRSMLAAQVPLVVASQWSVDSAATSDLMTRFHSFRTAGRATTTEALRQAQLSLLSDPSGKYSSPYYWAAFAAYGGHSSF